MMPLCEVEVHGANCPVVVIVYVPPAVGAPETVIVEPEGVPVNPVPPAAKVAPVAPPPHV